MNSNKGTQPETSAERAIADLAANKFKAYQQYWAPRQRALATTIQNMGKEGSFERTSLKAKGAADTSVKFDEAKKALAVRDVAMGNNRGSSAFKLRQAGLDVDKASSLGISSTLADQTIDDAYVSGLSTLMQLGRGQEAQASRGMSQAAQIQAGIASNDAEMAARARAGDWAAGGNILGMGVGAYANRSPGVSPMGAPNVGPQMGIENQPGIRFSN